MQSDSKDNTIIHFVNETCPPWWIDPTSVLGHTITRLPPCPIAAFDLFPVNDSRSNSRRTNTTSQTPFQKGAVCCPLSMILLLTEGRPRPAILGGRNNNQSHICRGSNGVFVAPASTQCRGHPNPRRLSTGGSIISSFCSAESGLGQGGDWGGLYKLAHE